MHSTEHRTAQEHGKWQRVILRQPKAVVQTANRNRITYVNFIMLQRPYVHRKGPGSEQLCQGQRLMPQHLRINSEKPCGGRGLPNAVERAGVLTIQSDW